MKDYVGKNMGKYISYKIFNASKYAYICSPYIDQYYADAILDLAEKGIEVKVLASDRQAGHFSLLRYFEENYEGGDNFDCVVVDGEGFVHSKIYVIDDNYAVDGSVNLTYNGLWNQVNDIHIYEAPDEVQNVKKKFNKLWQYNSKRTDYYDD